MIHKCPKCGRNLLISKTVIEEGEHQGQHHAQCLHCEYETLIAMKFSIGDDITFDGSIDKTKEVAYSGIKTEEEKKTCPNHGEGYITRFMTLQPHSHLRVTGFYESYYVCEKLWESGDEEIPIGGRGILVHEDEAIPYDVTYDGKVINKRKR